MIGPYFPSRKCVFISSAISISFSARNQQRKQKSVVENDDGPFDSRSTAIFLIVVWATSIVRRNKVSHRSDFNVRKQEKLIF